MDDLGAGETPPELLLAATFLAQASRTDADLQTLRKRQSFSFGDNRLGPTMPVEQAQTEAQLPKQLGVTAAAAAAHETPSVAAHEAAAVPGPGLSAASFRSAAASAAADAQAAESLGQPSSKPSMASTAGGRAKQPIAAAKAKVTAAQQANFPSRSSSKDPAVASSSADKSGEHSEDSAAKGRAAARAGPTSAPAGPSKPGQSHTAAKPLKHAVTHKPEWQH